MMRALCFDRPWPLNLVQFNFVQNNSIRFNLNRINLIEKKHKDVGTEDYFTEINEM